MDHLTRKQRSWNMSLIRSKDTKPEIIVRSIVHRLGFRFGLYKNKLIGSPDIVLKKHKTVIFVHGCFWHHHKNCKTAGIPKTNRKFWISKLEGNQKRDKIVDRKLRESGWKVITLWECQMKDIEKLKLEFIKQFCA